MSERLSVADARSAIVSGRDEDLQVNMDALLAAIDAARTTGGTDA